MADDSQSGDASIYERRTSLPIPVVSFTLVSLFPSIFESWLQQGVVARAVERGLVTVDLVDLRPFGVGKHRSDGRLPLRRWRGHGHEAGTTVRRG